MVVGYFCCRVRTAFAKSLKEKRGHVRRGLAKSKESTVREVGDHDSLDFAVLGAATVSTDQTTARRSLQSVLSLLAREFDIVSSRLDTFSMGALPAAHLDGFVPTEWQEIIDDN